MAVEITDELKEAYKRLADATLNSRGDRKAEFSFKAKQTIDTMRESLPDLDDVTVFTIFTSVAHLISSIMLTSALQVGRDLEDLFDMYNVASAAVIGVVDLADEAPAPTEDEQKMIAMYEEIQRLKEILAKSRPVEDGDTPGLYL